jgi:heterodisulfide reductase subunit B
MDVEDIIEITTVAIKTAKATTEFLEKNPEVIEVIEGSIEAGGKLYKVTAKFIGESPQLIEASIEASSNLYKKSEIELNNIAKKVANNSDVQDVMNIVKQEAKEAGKGLNDIAKKLAKFIF